MSEVERKGRGKLQTASTNKTVNVAASYKLEKAVSMRGVNKSLPSLDSVIDEVVESMEDEASLASVTNSSELVLVGVPMAGPEDEEQEQESTSEEAIAFAACEQALYAEWEDRPNDLP